MGYEEAQRELLKLRHLLEHSLASSTPDEFLMHDAWSRFLDALSVLYQTPRFQLNRFDQLDQLPLGLKSIVAVQYENNSWLRTMLDVANSTITSSQIIGSDRAVFALSDSEKSSCLNAFLEAVNLQINLQIEA